MSLKTSRGPLMNPGLCRCCGVMKKCRLLNVGYDYCGKTEVYSDMIMDCFGLVLSNIDGEDKDRAVCATCVVRLREAQAFRSQVLQCEEAFLLKLHVDDDFKVKIEIKTEENAEETVQNSDVLSSQVDDDPVENDYDDSVDIVEHFPLETPPLESLETEDTELKDEDRKLSELKSEFVKQKDKLDRMAKRATLVNKKQRLKMKRHVLIKTKQMKLMLEQKLNKTVIPSPLPLKTRRPQEGTTKITKPVRRMSRDRMAHHNKVILVENSFIVPFRNRISNYYCFYCKEIFTDCNELKAHTLQHDPKMFENTMEGKRMPKIDITRVDCRLCAEKIQDIQSCKSHLVTVHKKMIYPDVTDEFLTFRLSMDNINCLECGKNFPFIDKLIDHMTDHFGKYVCEVCGAYFIEESSLIQHMRRHKKIEQDFPCDSCGKNFKSNYSRQLHIATVHEKRPIVDCFKCDASFFSYAQRNRHLINAHGDKRKYPCTSCDKVFDVRKTMVEHTRKYHLQVCRHQCDICDQRFYAPSQLKEHKATHTGERNFRCEYCDKSYPRRQSLQDHIRSHTNDRRYKCEICCSAFTQNGSLKNHMKSHHQGFDLVGSYNQPVV